MVRITGIRSEIKDQSTFRNPKGLKRRKQTARFDAADAACRTFLPTHEYFYRVSGSSEGDSV